MQTQSTKRKPNRKFPVTAYAYLRTEDYSAGKLVAAEHGVSLSTLMRTLLLKEIAKRDRRRNAV
jgi:hypothetical protein